MNTRARSASFGLATAAIALLGAHRAIAMDEPVEAAEKPHLPVVHPEIDPRQFRNDLDAYVRALADGVRGAIAAPPKPDEPRPAENLELAAALPRTSG